MAISDTGRVLNQLLETTKHRKVMRQYPTRRIEEMNCIVLCHPTQWAIGRRMGSRVYMAEVGKGICLPRVVLVVCGFVWVVGLCLANFREVY